jgi:hypothetical protein
MLKRLWLDEGGAILSTELILILVITVIGLITGLVALRDSVDLQLADLAGAIAAIDVSYAWDGTAYTCAETCGLSGSAAAVAGSSYKANVAQICWPKSCLHVIPVTCSSTGEKGLGAAWGP